MASINESLFNTPNARRAMSLHKDRIEIMESTRKSSGLGDTSFERKLATAIMLENTRKRVKALEANYGMGNATQPSSVGQYKRYAMDMVATFGATLIAPEVVSVQALDNRVGMINILQFKYGNTKGSATQGEVFASPLSYQGMNTSYTTASVDGEDLVAVNGVYTLSYTPVKEGTVRIVAADGTVRTNYTVDPETGVITDTGSSITDGDKAYYLYDNETVPVNAPSITMDIKSLPITTQSRKLRAIWSFDAEYELQKEYGNSMRDLLTTQATNEITQEIDNEITKDLYRIANAGPEVTWSRIQQVGVSAADHYDSFWQKIVEGSNEIFNATRRSHANFMICGLGVDAVLKCMRNFDASEDLQAIGPHFVGTLGGSIKCYVNPFYDADTFVLGYKGNTLIDAGYAYCPYMPILTTGMVTLDDFASREGWATMYGKKAINPRLYVKGRIIG